MMFAMINNSLLTSFARRFILESSSGARQSVNLRDWIQRQKHGRESTFTAFKKRLYLARVARLQSKAQSMPVKIHSMLTNHGILKTLADLQKCKPVDGCHGANRGMSPRKLNRAVAVSQVIWLDAPKSRGKNAHINQRSGVDFLTHPPWNGHPVN